VEAVSPDASAFMGSNPTGSRHVLELCGLGPRNVEAACGKLRNVGWWYCRGSAGQPGPTVAPLDPLELRRQGVYGPSPTPSIC
jgi:hypothetical protein